MPIDLDPNRRDVPEYRNVMPLEVLDPKALIPPSEFNLRRRDVEKGAAGTSPTTNGGTPGLADLTEATHHQPQ